MTLCPTARCGCTITSSTLQVTGKVGGVGYNLETYEGIATEDPDTRPGASERFEGMRVWTSDTKRLWIWDDDVGLWRILTEERQSWVPTITQGVALTTSAPTAWYQRSMGGYSAQARIVISSAGTVSQPFSLSLPEELVTLDEAAGGFYYLDVGAVLYAGQLHESTTTETIFVSYNNNNAFGVTPSLAAASGDRLTVNFIGTYDEAAI